MALILIILLIMSRHSSLKDSSASSLANGPTVFQAMRTLKMEQERVIEEVKRSKVISRHNSREHMNSVNRQRKSQFYASVQQAAHQHKELKKEHQRKQIEEVKNRYSINMKHRERNKKMIEDVRRSFHNANNELYQRVRERKEQNESVVKTARNTLIQSRISNRVQRNEEESYRRKSIQNFYEQRQKSREDGKRSEVEALLRKSQQRQKQLGLLRVQNSRVRENKVESSLENSFESAKNPEVPAGIQAE